LTAECTWRTIVDYGAVFKPRSFRIAYRFSVERMIERLRYPVVRERVVVVVVGRGPMRDAARKLRIEDGK